MTKLKEETIEKVRAAFSRDPRSMAEAARFAEMQFNTFAKYAKELNLYVPNPSGRGIEKRRNGGKVPLELILDGRCPDYNTTKLKKRMIAEGLIENKCLHCGVGPSWNGLPLSLHLDHINGNNRDHMRSNLRILCPNCHSQTETYCGKNSKGARNVKITDEELINALHAAHSIAGALTLVGLRSAKYYSERCKKLCLDDPTLAEKYNIVRALEVRASDVEVSFGSHEEWLGAQQSKLNQIKNSNVDFSTRSWATQAGRLIGMSPQQLRRWLIRVDRDFLKQCSGS